MNLNCQLSRRSEAPTTQGVDQGSFAGVVGQVSRAALLSQVLRVCLLVAEDTFFERKEHATAKEAKVIVGPDL